MRDPVPELAGQNVGLPPVGIKKPASAMQSVIVVDPVSEPVPELEGQAVHAAADAATSLYIPELHAATALPLPVYPAFARQLFSSPEDAGLLLLEGQSRQSVGD